MCKSRTARAPGLKDNARSVDMASEVATKGMQEGDVLPSMVDGDSAKLLLILSIICVAVLVIVHVVCWRCGQSKTLRIELHGYQMEFLQMLSEYEGHPRNAMQFLCTRAAREPEVKCAIFDHLHCVHCSSKQPASWIKSAGIGNRQGFEWPLSAAVCELLTSELLLPVEKVGSPPMKRLVIDGQRRADVSKAARCIIDWAIVNYGAQTDDGHARFREICDDQLPLAEYSLLDCKKSKAE